MDELERAIEDAGRMREARKRLNELAENIAAWAGGGLRIDGSRREKRSDSESVTKYDVADEDPLLRK